MNKKRLYKIPADVLLQAQAKLDEVINFVEPHLVALAPPERQILTKVGAEAKEFLELSHGLAVEYPELFPEFMKESAFKEMYLLARKLWVITKKIDRLRDTIRDTEMLAGNHALELALDYYRTVKIAVRHDLPGARGIYEKLKSRIPPRKQRMRNAG